MTKIIPDNPRQQLRFFKTRIDEWKSDPQALGLSQPIVDALEADIDAAIEAFDSMNALRSAAEAATQTFQHAVATMTKRGRGAVGAIKSHAALTDNPEVLNEAQIRPPDTVNSERPAPPPPSSVAMEFTSAGALILMWKPPLRSVGNWNGKTFFQIERSLQMLNAPQPTPWMLVGNSSGRRYVDITIPKGVTNVRYRIRAVRNGKRSAEIYTQMDLYSTATDKPGERVQKMDKRTAKAG